jgi:hypothetical protein
MLSVRFCSLKTGLAHPLAKRPVISMQLEFSITPYETYSTICLSIAGELLILNLISNDPTPLCTNMSYEVLIFDWHTGTLLNRTGSQRGFCSAACLDNDRLVAFVANVGSHDTDTETLHSANLSIYEWIRAPCPTRPSYDEGICNVSEYSSLSPTLKLEFPVFGPTVKIQIRDFLLRSAPTPGGATSRASTFVPDPSYRTLSLTITVLLMHYYSSMTIFVDVQKLFHHLSEARSRSLGILPWAQWGENSTRWFESAEGPSPWISCIHGSRFVIERHVEWGIEAQLAVAEFNTSVVRRFRTHESDNYVPSPASGSEELLQKRDDAVRNGQWPFLTNFSEAGQYDPDAVVIETVDDTPTVILGLSPIPIVSKLPYRLATVVRPSTVCDYWMIDGNRIIGIGVRFFIAGFYNEEMKLISLQA